MTELTEPIIFKFNTDNRQEIEDFKDKINAVRKQGITEGRKQAFEEVEKIIDEMENHYPKDIFLWNNPEKLDFNRGRFYQFAYMVVENVRTELKRKIKDLK